MMEEVSPQTEQKIFRIIVLVCAIFVSLPFLFVRFIPSTDLPQHLAQIRLLHDILNSPTRTEYSINWFGANTLVYYLLQVNWMIFDPILAGKMTVLEIALSWVIGIFALSHHHQRSKYAAIIACLCIFNFSLYWGFLNFLIGFPIYILWYILIIESKREYSTIKKVLLIVSVSVLLFLAHTLWLLVAIIHLFVATINQRPGYKEIAIRCIALLPIGIYSIIWFTKLESTRTALGSDTTAHWMVLPFQRIDPYWITDSVFGGLRGPTEAIILSGIIVWMILSVTTNWKNLRLSIEWEYLIIGIILATVVFLAPEKYINTIYFASRWAPISMIFFLLALPTPRLNELFNFAFSTLLFTILAFTTCFFWYRFEAIENPGLSECIQALTKNPRVMGLDFVRRSDIICGRPFMQTFAYAQVLHGGELNFSFAEHHSGIVSFKDRNRKPRWTTALEWGADRVQYKDFSQFDFVLMNGGDAIHREIGSLPVLSSVTKTGRWRLYRCLRETDRILSLH
jgi:hypothetical protein